VVAVQEGADLAVAVVQTNQIGTVETQLPPLRSVPRWRTGGHFRNEKWIVGQGLICWPTFFNGEQRFQQETRSKTDGIEPFP
jgi:hypothetical protein